MSKECDSDSANSINNTNTASVGFYRDSKSYNFLSIPDGEGGRITFRQHQANCPLDYSIREVFADQNVVHHILPAANSDDGKGASVDLPDNVVVVDQAEHLEIHRSEDHEKLAHDIEEILPFESSDEDVATSGKSWSDVHAD